GIPVIITEFGARDKDNEDARIRWAEYVLKSARPLGIPCVWWDGGGRPEEKKSFSLYDRYSRVWLFPDLTAALTK
ncbi:cellulase family glycosylhydrolase, partial [Oscillibacter sp.]|uniref:cellulase family glycosylhydrolase n=1 Tax=Oscillibacter sp. TaxID=1945593 RepID=UPI0028AEA84A